MSEITIVTAFFDIGRGSWSPSQGLPAYLQRTNDTYFERFANMASLENEMVVFTSEDLVERVNQIRGDKKTHINVVDFSKSFNEYRTKISDVQNNVEYLKKINLSQIKNPEYWNADYVLVNALKSTFVKTAINKGQVTNDLVAWLDFGYCRTKETLNGVKRWYYPFNKDKIHLFNLKEYDGQYIEQIISNNDVHITGPCIVAGREMWPLLEKGVFWSLEKLLENNLVDDDQTLLLMSYLLDKSKFELHPVSPNDWFVAFKDYNETAN
jgi:protein YibB